METARLERSMSRKGYSLDHSAYEGLFGRVKNKMFYNRNWNGIGILRTKWQPQKPESKVLITIRQTSETNESIAAQFYFSVNTRSLSFSTIQTLAPLSMLHLEIFCLPPINSIFKICPSIF